MALHTHVFTCMFFTCTLRSFVRMVTCFASGHKEAKSALYVGSFLS
ncbi:hypothetical protein CsSME_00020977 [Camellia sinensis var. sinensis]